MSSILSFYRATSTDSEGRSLDSILTWDDDQLEEVHDFIQWLFPLPEPSRFNPDAPLLTDDDIATFRADPALNANLKKAFERILAFLGLALAEGEVVEGPNFASRVSDVWAAPNHNWLRITRILRSLRLLGLEAEAMALYERLDRLYTRRRFPIDQETFAYWTDAART